MSHLNRPSIIWYFMVMFLTCKESVRIRVKQVSHWDASISSLIWDTYLRQKYMYNIATIFPLRSHRTVAGISHESLANVARHSCDIRGTLAWCSPD